MSAQAPAEPAQEARTVPVRVDRHTTVTLAQFSRDEFLQTRWRYRAGEHVTILGPTDCGKTTLGFQLLQQTATPKLPAVVLVMKPRDATVARWGRDLKFRRVRSWPPRMPWVERPAGWTLWPKHTFDFDRDDAILQREMFAAMRDSYRRGNRILFGDEVYGLSAELGLARPLTTIWSRGRSMGCGLWAASQKPTHIPLWAYSMAAHLFLYHDPDRRARERFAEIGGVDPKVVEAAVMGLGDHQALYIRRAGRVMCVVDA